MVQVVKPTSSAMKEADRMAAASLRRRPALRGGHYDPLSRSLVLELAGSSASLSVPVDDVQELASATQDDLRGLVVEAPNLIRCDAMDVHVDAGGLILDLLSPKLKQA